MLYSVSSYQSLPQKPGVYFFLDEKGTILYIGKAKNLRDRVSSYFAQSADLQGKTHAMVAQIKQIQITIVTSEIESLLLEANYIKKHTPKYNIRLTDGKAYPLIRVTIHDISPSVTIARRMEDAKSLYFGPYPNAKALHMVLRTIRKIFPYQSTLHHAKKVCLYHHLGLCPCLPAFADPALQQAYKKTITHITDFLEGNTKKVITDLTKERDAYTKVKNYEKSKNVQQQITAVHLVTQPVWQPFEYETNPHLASDLREKEMQQLQAILAQNDVEVAVPERIECYDISNFAGKQATASMVVFINGEKDGSQYRKFKMKTSGPNDFAMMQEVLTRRLKHTEWPLPQLFIVDGGKGQISSAQQVFRQKGITIPLVGLAKREEIIITTSFIEIKLSRRSPALQLIMRIRDEAHRFAVGYHKKLRAIAFLQNE